MGASKSFSWVTIALVAMSSGMLTGCDKSCQDSCRKVYEPSECGIQIVGREAETSIRECVSECSEALQNTGDMGTYNPNIPGNASTEYRLENEKQAAAWMDCVTSATCEQLDSANGICQPI